MVDRFLVWLRAGVVTAGLSAAILAGAGAAIADDGSSSDGGGSASSESSNSADSAKDSAAGEPTGSAASSRASNATTARTTGVAPRTRVGAKAPDDTKGAKSSEATDKADRSADRNKPAATPKDAGTATAEAKDAETAATVTDDAPAADAVVEQPVVEQPVTGQPVVDDSANEVPTTDAEVIEEVATSRSNRDHTDQRATAVVSPNAATATRETTTGPTEDTAVKKAALVAEIDRTVEVAAAEERTAVVLEQPAATVVEDTEEIGVHAVAFASAPPAVTTATAPQIPLILRVIGTIVFDLYAVATRLLGGPPILPPNSTVTVRSSTLRIDCACAEGEGGEVPADWYIPQTAEGAPPPDRLVYLQHGFLASAPWYSHTAAALAERTNSIVVAPSISSNFFALDGCWLGGAPMHEAMAGLFDGENTALLESARAAGYSGAIPDRVVLMGHSLGGGAVSGMAGYMVDKQTVDRLAGLVLLDGVALGDPAVMTESLRKVPQDIPIYQLAAPVYMWNNFGAGLDATLAARPGQFVGVTLVNGSHVDAMRGGNPLIQFAQELVAGFSRPENSAAAQMLMVGWVNDMFDPEGAKEGVYLQPGEQYSFDTPAGRATVVALPNTLTKPFLLNFLEPFMPLADGLFSMDPVCVRESVGSTGSGHCSNAIAA
ncbi:hypothetical protein A5790_23170 [Mycobacterium sp. 852002-51152_SCH6134967]|uniref:alpha/beta hydrolase family protein n=1 Tax=Mycobacterium sp. 852002-51152_SCH6134967 TaxID=1834096 RepID=UPI0007FE80B5|nr:alpha/beta hydrolase [Mycobacterium sp. 852002-51152_SCH6134967]OBF88871.1 hypothetical protein A5790_23170 [Mycobacterium sp. 852002-51152_SCH6134967]